jgi:hypothetical protein
MDATQATAVNGILLATMAGALVVLAGALYAGVFAIGKIFNSPSLVKLSYLFYAVLVVAVLVLDRTLGFTGAWDLIIVAMLAGYLFAPQAIWKLCEGTHLHTHETSPSGAGEQALDQSVNPSLNPNADSTAGSAAEGRV